MRIENLVEREPGTVHFERKSSLLLVYLSPIIVLNS